MRKPRPSLYQIEAWASWERFCGACLVIALEELRSITPLPEEENALNGLLHGCLRRAAKKLRPLGPYETIGYEAPPQPFGEAEELLRRLKPCPDFVWGYVDHREPNALLNSRQFVIECKRLRHPSKSWKYNVSYVDDGILRFVDTSKRYGIGVSSGAMVGYWQAMDGDVVLAAVNTAATGHRLQSLVLSGPGWRPQTVTRLSQSLVRSFPENTYQLGHFWIDLRPLPIAPTQA